MDTTAFVFCILWLCMLVTAIDKVEYQVAESCPYFGFESSRVVGREHGLVNCSWYTGRSCCKRTEVTSVFSKMFSLYGATLGCKNQMNYLMCYFCDPQQNRWIIDRKAHICADFCRSVYVNCKDAKYEGRAIGDAYRNGSSFCESQNFKVVEGDNCFDYDPTVFGEASILHHINLVVLTLVVVVSAMVT